MNEIGEACKVIIVGMDNEEMQNIAKHLSDYDDDLTLARHFTTDKEKKDITNEFEYYIDMNTLYMACKNNAVVTINYTDDLADGIMVDDFYNNTICWMTIHQFNMVPDTILNKHNVIVVWTDSSKHTFKESGMSMVDVQYLENRLEKIPYIYFLNDDVKTICNIILEYINGDFDKKQYILDENH